LSRLRRLSTAAEKFWATKLVDRLAEILPHLGAQRRRVWPVVGEGEIELQDLGGEGLHRHILAAVDAIGGPDQESEDESR
jgi:hypothetical protein